MKDSFNTYIQNDSFYQPTPEPTPTEKRSIRKLYNSVGGTMICQYILVFVLFYIAYFILTGMGLIETTYNDEGYPIVGFWECTCRKLCYNVFYIQRNAPYQAKQPAEYGKGHRLIYP